MIVRNADAKRDASACAAIYAPYVEHTVASFETQAPTTAEMSARIETAVVWVIADDQQGILGYAYGSAHRERAAYRWAADVAVYVAAEHHRRGIGRALYAQLFTQMREIGMWTLCAGITLPNASSTGLHGAMGFQPVGTYKRIGYKHAAWRDVQWWQLDLRPGEPGPPGEPALASTPR